LTWLKTIVDEVFGLFVDDGSFAVAILAWLAFAWLALPHAGLPASAKGPVLFLGLAAILVESAARRSRQ
jgi:hypothetical protein